MDTVVLSGNSDLPDGGQLNGDELPGPADPLLAQTQLEWVRMRRGLWDHLCTMLVSFLLSCLQLQSTLAASTADYLVVAGHYPVWSVCEHGPTAQLVTSVKPLLEQYKVIDLCVLWLGSL